MTIEKLTPEQYPILKDVADGYVPDPANSIAIVAKDGADVVGRVLVVAVCHVEGTWVKETHRGGTVAARLYKKLEQEAKALGLTALLAYSQPEHNDYMRRLGFRPLALTVWQKEL